MHDAGLRQPRHDGRGARPRRRPGRGRLPPRRQRRVGGQLQRARPGRHRRLARGRRRRRRRRQGARRQEGDAAAGLRRVPHAVHGARPRPAAQGDRRGEPARHRGAGRLQRRRAARTTRAPSGRSLLSAQLSSPVRWKHCLLTLASLGVTELRRARAGRRADRHGQAHGRRRRARSSISTPEDLDKLLEWVHAGASSARRAARGRAPVRRRADRRQPGGRRVHADRRHRRRCPHRGRHRARHDRRHRGALARSPACCRATSRSPASASPTASRSPG